MISSTQVHARGREARVTLVGARFSGGFEVRALVHVARGRPRDALAELTQGTMVAPAAWIPLAILAFGMGDGAAIFVVFVGIYFTLTLATLNNMNNVDQVYVNTARVLGARRRQIMWHVIFPAILPNLFVVIRMNFFAAWMGVLAAEMVGVRSGLGAVVVMGRQMMNMNLTFLGMAIIGLVGYLLDVGLGLLQKRMLWWRSAARV